MTVGVILLLISIYLKLKHPADPENKKAVALQKRQKAVGIILTLAMIILWVSAILRATTNIGSAADRIFRPILNAMLILMFIGLFALFIHNDISAGSAATKRERQAIDSIRKAREKSGKARPKKPPTTYIKKSTTHHSTS